MLKTPDIHYASTEQQIYTAISDTLSMCWLYDPLRSFSSLHTFYTYIYIVEALLYYTYTPHTA